MIAHRRIRITRNNKNFYNFGDDNRYPLNTIERFDNSPTLNRCVRMLSSFIRGNGFQSYLSNIKVNKIDTLSEYLSDFSDETSLHQGIYIHFKYNSLLEKVSTEILPFENCRIGLGDHEGKILYSIDWTKSNASIIEYDIYTSNKEALNVMALNAGGVEEWNGTVLFLKYDRRSKIYPKNTFDSVTIPVESEIASVQTSYNNVSTNFTAKYVVSNNSPSNNNNMTSDNLNCILEDFIGPDGGAMLKLDGVQINSADGDGLQFIKLDNTLNDAIFRYTDEKIENQIIRNFGQPRALHAFDDSSLFSNSEHLNNAKEYYNKMTQPYRIFVKNSFEEIFKNWHIPITNRNFEIIPL